MTEYYPDSDERIGFSKAEELVDEFAVEHTESRTLVSVRDVCRKMGVADTEHNRRRVLHALQRRFSECDDWATKRFEVDR